jgi:hypothetical protein
LLRGNGTASVPFPGVRVTEMADSFAEDLKMRFSNLIAVLQIYLFLETNVPLKSVMFWRNCN